MYTSCVNSGMGVGDSTQNQWNTLENRHIYQSLKMASLSHWLLHTHEHTLHHTHAYSNCFFWALTNPHTHLHTHSIPNSVVVGRVGCDELYVSSRLLKVNFLKTAAHWRGEEIIGGWEWVSLTRRVCVCVWWGCQHHSAGIPSEWCSHQQQLFKWKLPLVGTIFHHQMNYSESLVEVAHWRRTPEK